MSQDGPLSSALDGTRTVDSARLWEATYWVILGFLVYWVGQWFAGFFAFLDVGFLHALLSFVVTLTALVVAVFLVLKGLTVLLEAVFDGRPA